MTYVNAIRNFLQRNGRLQVNLLDYRIWRFHEFIFIRMWQRWLYNTPFQKLHFIIILSGRTFPFQCGTWRPQNNYCPCGGRNQQITASKTGLETAQQSRTASMGITGLWLLWVTCLVNGDSSLSHTKKNFKYLDWIFRFFLISSHKLSMFQTYQIWANFLRNEYNLIAWLQHLSALMLMHVSHCPPTKKLS